MLMNTLRQRSSCLDSYSLRKAARDRHTTEGFATPGSKPIRANLIISTNFWCPVSSSNTEYTPIDRPNWRQPQQVD